MTTIYDNAVKIARMAAVISQAGTTAVLELGTNAMGAILASTVLNNPIAPTPTGVGLMTLAGFPKNATAAAAGKALSARVRTGTGGANIITGWDVGLTPAAAPAWVASTAYALDAKRTNGANIYKVTTAGTSAGSGGPTGTGTGITDGTVTWEWYCKAGAEVQLDDIEFNVSQVVTINSAAVTHAA